MSDKVLVATYGSLRRNMHNAMVNDNANAVFVGKGKTKENFDLFEYGGGAFPSVSLVHSESNTPVVVDLYETTGAGLTGAYDWLEGYRGPEYARNFYNRTKVNILKDDGEEVEAWLYHIDEEQPVRVPSGDWCLHKDANYYERI